MRQRAARRTVFTAAAVVAMALFGAAVPPLPAGAAPAAPCTDEYVGPDGGAWGQAADWSAGVPQASTVVCWSAATDVVVSEAGAAAGGISSGGSLTLQGAGSLELTAAPPASSVLAGAVQVTGAARLELHVPLACGSAALQGGEILDDGALECALDIAGGTLAGTGSVSGAVLNEGGTVAPGDGEQPGGLSVGSYQQGGAATLAASENVTGAEANAHLLRVAGAVSLAGTLSIQPASPATGFPLLGSSSAPQGSFAVVTAPSEGGPWTVAYGPSGAVAVMGGSATLKAVITGTRAPGSTVGCGIAEGWEPRGAASYSWKGPLDRSRGESAEGYGLEPLLEELSYALRDDQGPAFVLPGSAAGRTISCSVTMMVPAGGVPAGGGVAVPPATPAVVAQVPPGKPAGTGGNPPSVSVEGTADTTIGGPNWTQPPRIRGRVLPGRTLSCSPGSWEGNPSHIAYAWQLGVNRIANGRTYRVGRTLEAVLEEEHANTLTCLVTAYYGAIGIPAEAALRIPGRPQPTLCPRRAVALVSTRRASGALLLFGAATQRYFGERVYALRGDGHDRTWRRVAAGRVNGSGYFELRVPRRLAAGGAYRVSVGGATSEPVREAGPLEIVSDRSRPGESDVVLRLSQGARHGETVTVSPLTECSPGAALTSARLAPGGELALRLTAPTGAGAGFYLARVRTGRVTRSVELIVPARRQAPLPEG